METRLLAAALLLASCAPANRDCRSPAPMRCEQSTGPVHIIGAVAQPRAQRPSTLREALCANPATETGWLGGITIVRKHGPDRIRLRVDPRDCDVQLCPGDIVYVPERI